MISWKLGRLGHLNWLVEIKAEPFPRHRGFSKELNLDCGFHNWQLSTSVSGCDKTFPTSNTVNQFFVVRQLAVDVITAI